MKKLPIGETIRFAYQFTFGQIGTIIGLIWIPMLIQVVGSYFVLTPFYNAAAAALAGNNPELMRTQILMLLLFELVTLFLYAVMAVAIVQQALGLRQGLAFAHFAVGGAEIRVFGGFVGFIFLFVLFLIAYKIIANIAAAAIFPRMFASPANAGMMGQYLLLLGFVLLFYPLARLSYFIVPAALVEGGFGIARSWELTKGNFLRFFAIGLATLLPVLLLMMIASAFVQMHYGAMTVQNTQTAELIHQINIAITTLPLMLGLGFVVAPMVYGMALAPAAFAYRALTKAGD